MDEGRIYKIFGRRVAARRAEMRLTQLELAGRVDLSRASIANIERGHQKLTLHIVYRIAAALGLKDPWELLPHFATTPTAMDQPTAFNIVGRAEGLSEAERQQVERLYSETPVARS
jgi:transcriptional regulator with XRE-family HTH domain